MTKTFETLMAKTKTLNYDELKEEGEKLFNQKINEENYLLSAYNDKKLKSKKLIRTAQSIKRKRSKKKDKKG